MVKAMLTYQYTYAYGAVSPLDGKFDSLVLPLVNTECMQLFITVIGKRYPEENIVMVVDGAGWHKSKTFALPENLRLHFLPPYSPKLNPQEHIWDELREKYFHNLCQRLVEHRPGCHRLCAGRNHHRLVPESVRLGAVSHHQSGGEDAYSAGSAWTAAPRLGWPGRSIYRCLKVARIIADLAGAAKVQVMHVAEAVQYRRPLKAH